MVWEPIPDEHTHILTHTQTHRQTKFYNIRLTVKYCSSIRTLNGQHGIFYGIFDDLSMFFYFVVFKGGYFFEASLIFFQFFHRISLLESLGKICPHFLFISATFVQCLYLCHIQWFSTVFERWRYIVKEVLWEWHFSVFSSYSQNKCIFRCSEVCLD